MLGRSVLAMAVAAGGFGFSAGAQDRTVQEILDRAVEAMGGRAAIEAIGGATYEVVSEDGGVDETHFMRDPFDQVHIKWSPMHQGSRGCVGEVAWFQRVDTGGSLLVELQPVDDPFMFAHTFHRIALDPLQDIHRAEIAERANADGVEGVEIVFTFGDDRRRRVTFSNDTGLPMSVTIETGRRTPSWGYAFAEWTQQGDITMFTKLTPLRPGESPARVTATYAAPPDDAFNPPPAVKALLAHQEQAVAAAQRREEISHMDEDGVRAELARVARERSRAQGTPRHAELRREFVLLRDRMRELATARQTSSAGGE